MDNNKLIEPVEIGDYVKVYNKKGCGAMGYLIGCTELLSNGNIVKMYTIMIDNNKYIDICEDDIIGMVKSSIDGSEKVAFADKFKETYGIDLLDSDGNKKNASDIVNTVLVNDIWAKMDDAEKTDFVKFLCMDIDTNVDLISALDMGRKRNNELHQKIMDHLNERIKLKNMAMDFQKNWNEMENQMPESFRWAYDFIYKYFGIEDLIREI